MTPMKSIILFGRHVLVEDMAEKVELKATCPTERDADWLASSLSAFHKVEIKRPPDQTAHVLVALDR